LSEKIEVESQAWGPRLAASLQFWLINLGFGLLISLGYLQRAPEDLSARGIFFLCFGMLSSLGLLSLVPGILGAALALTTRHRHRLARRLGLLWTVSLLLLYADTRIFGVFRFHLNAVVWNGLTTPGAGDAIHPGVADVILPTFAFIGIVTTEAWIFRRLLARCEQHIQIRRPLRPAIAAAAALLLALSAERQLYARDQEQGLHELATLSELLPYYTLPQSVMRKLRDEPLTLGEQLFEVEELALNWPTHPLRFDGDQRPNVLMLVVDGLRADMLNAETMPRTHAFSEGARVFESHWSGGNCTRHGVFSLLYGLHGNYWARVLEEQRSPVLVDSLLELGYEPRVICSAAQSFPEFRSTAWVEIQDAVEDEFTGEAWQKDRMVAARFADWLGERKDPSRPFFSFSLLDSTHANYSFPEDEVHFEPSAESVGYIQLSYGLEQADQEALFNRYRNSVRHADLVIGQFLDSLEAAGQLDNTLVLITGDHGEEFFENGYWGHHSNFTDEQVAVPFILRGPGITPGREARPSGHIDFSRTLLEILGVSPGQAAHYALGENLLDLPDERSIVASSWSSLAYRSQNGPTVVVSAYSDDLPVRAYGPDWSPVHNEQALIRQESSTLASLLSECRRYLHASPDPEISQ